MNFRKALLLILFLPFLGYGQKAVFNQVQIAKESGKYFREISPFKFVSDDLSKGNVFPETLKDGVFLKKDQKALNEILNLQPEQLTLLIPVSSTQNIKVDVVKNKIFADGFFVSTNESPDVSIGYKEGVHYKGVVSGDPNSIVAFSFFRNEIIALISDQNGNRVIGRLENDLSETYVFYSDKDLAIPNPYDCYTADDGKAYLNSQLQRNGSGSGNSSSSLGDCINVYIEIDDDVVAGKGGAVNATNYVTSLFNQCIILYNNEQLNMAITQILCWTTTSPYAGSSSTSALLGSYQSNTGTFNGNLSHLVSYRGGGGEAAGFSGICNADPDQSKCVSKIYSTYSNVPTYSWSVNVITHEMGHLIGSRHTHACVWNGNNTAIDGCAGYVEGSCSLPGNPSGGGTIMSYCHLQSVGMNFSLGFGTQPGNVIRNTILNSTCTHACGYTSCSDGFKNGQETGIDCGGPSCPACPGTCSTPSGVSVNSISVSYATVVWNSVVGAVTYTLEYKLNSSSTWIVASSTISNTNSYYLSGLTGSSLYDYRIKTNCSSTSSSYFQGQFTTLTPAACNSNYEPNESMGVAATIPANTTITATIGTPSDLDYYKLTIAVASDFTVNLTNLAGDYDMKMFNSAGTSIGLSENAGTTSESITLANQAAGTYYFFVYGYGGANSPTMCYNLNVGVAATGGCSTPTGLTSSAITNTTATISWSAVSGAVNYNVEYKLNSSSTWTVASSTHTTTSYNLSSLTAGSLYDFRIRANCSSGNSTYGQAQFTTSPACVYNNEPNETQATAILVSANTTVSSGINSATDLDYFKVTTAGTVDFNVTLTNLPADFDIQMYNASGTLIASSTNGGSISENIILANQPAGTYSFKIFGFQGVFSASVCYNLFIGTTASLYSSQVKLFIEGFYTGTSTMRAVADPTSFPTLCDTVTIQLANSASPFAIAQTLKGTINTSGVGTFLFPNSVSGGSYYIVVTHRNSLQMWSASAVSFAGTSNSYDFTTSLSKAFGNKQVLSPDGKACMYSGDVNQDNAINNTDYTSVNSIVNLFQTGYVVSDLTGDRCVESADYSLIENHIGVSISKP